MHLYSHYLNDHVLAASVDAFLQFADQRLYFGVFQPVQLLHSPHFALQHIDGRTQLTDGVFLLGQLGRNDLCLARGVE
jgi:hypothetical protein